VKVSPYQPSFFKAKVLVFFFVCIFQSRKRRKEGNFGRLRKIEPGGAFWKRQPKKFLKGKDLGRIKKTVSLTIFDRGFLWDEGQKPRQGLEVSFLLREFP